MIVLGFVALAALGSLVRVIISTRLNREGFPYGTLFINVLGAFLLGVISDSSSATLILFGAGALGAMTTFSTLSQEAVNLSKGKRVGTAIFYITSTLVAGIAAAWLGLILGGA